MKEGLLDEAPLRATGNHQVFHPDLVGSALYQTETDHAVGAVFVRTFEEILLEAILFKHPGKLTPGIFGPGEIELIGALREFRRALEIIRLIAPYFEPDVAIGEEIEVIRAEIRQFLFAAESVLIVAPAQPRVLADAAFESGIVEQSADLGRIDRHHLRQRARDLRQLERIVIHESEGIQP